MRTVLRGMLGIMLTSCSTGAKAPSGKFTLSWSANERLIPRLESALQREPENPDVMSALGHAYVQKARESGDAQYNTEAERLFERALEANTDHVEALAGQASIAMWRHEFQKARDISESALKLNPYSTSASGILADALVELRDYDAAVRVVDEMTRRKPNLASYSRVSYMRELKGNREGAIQAMQMAIQAGSPDWESTAWCMVELGKLYTNSRRLVEAEAVYKATLRRFPDYVHAFVGLGKVASVRNELDTAIEYYQEAVDRVPAPEYVIELAAMYRKKGMKAEADAQLQRLNKVR